MVSKASLESLARTMSVALITLTVFGAGYNQLPSAHAVDDSAKLITDSREVKASRDRLLASETPAPADLEERGVWLKNLLYEAGFRGTDLKEAWAVAMKESTGRPLAHNGNSNTGDNSYGLFQINMIGDLGASRREKFGLASNSELFEPLTNAKIAHHMSNGGKDWSSWDISSSGYNGGLDKERYQQWLAKFPKG